MVFRLNTLEIRWFSHGSIPASLFDWFGALKGLEIFPTRTDLYLLGTGGDLGVKLREGRIETKQRTSQLGEMVFGSSFIGCLEEWVKWSLEVEYGAFSELKDQDQWLPVEKTRQQILFYLPDDGAVEVSDPDQSLTSGGSFELAQISVLGQPWWTVGVEVFGEQRRQHQILTGILKFAQENGFDYQLELDRSASYPAWINNF